jgi:hypothetical protein
MPTFRKKPVVIEASQWNGWGDHHAVTAYLDHHEERPDRPCEKCGKPICSHGWVYTLESGHIVCPGDWIITGVQGENYPCKPDIFEATYEKVTE